MPYQKVTRIEDLPDLDPQPPVNIHRFIRPPENDPYPESGMSYGRMAAPNSPLIDDMPMPMPMEPSMPIYQPKIENTYEHYERDKTVDPKDCSCKYIYEHIKECDICKRFYRPDVTPYLIIILILVIACAMMAKKLFTL